MQNEVVFKYITVHNQKFISKALAWIYLFNECLLNNLSDIDLGTGIKSEI